ncbi:hypothetical protein B0H14DRAFT_2944517 [Mycena olivaceomarginata]|nr:hypothetical protein B0H14DRAFT_2944517 [Mycena olivaceomarginata]
MAALPDAEARTAEPQIVVEVIHDIDKDLNMSSALKKERSKEFIVYDADAADERDSTSSSSGDDEISIHVESPVHDESLSSSALTAVSASTQFETDATATEESSPLRRSRVRFRSRVRITSGLHHSHRRVSTTSSSSLSSSPSSSISAPLRAPLTEDNCTPGWGTLGQRVGLFAISNRAAAEARSSDPMPNERSALLAPPGYERNPESDDDGSIYSECDDDAEALLSRQIDLVFGKWPGRLLNHHWWWWQLQPIMCCGCLDEYGEN